MFKNFTELIFVHLYFGFYCTSQNFEAENFIVCMDLVSYNTKVMHAYCLQCIIVGIFESYYLYILPQTFICMVYDIVVSLIGILLYIITTGLVE